MYTLITLLTIYYIYVLYKLYRIAKKNNEMFNPFEGTLIDWMFFLIGTAFWIGQIIKAFVTYLP